MTPGFSTLSIKVETSDGRNVIVLEDFSFTDSKGNVYVVPAGSKSDGASTPRFLWRELPPFGVYWLAAVFHDWLFRYSKLPEHQCNALLLEAMVSLNVPLLERQAIFEGVSLGGWVSFAEDRKAQTA